MEYTKEQQEQINRLNEMNALSKKIYIDILKESIAKVENMDSYNCLEDITTDMILKLRDESFWSMVNGEKYVVMEIVQNLIDFNKEFKNYPIDIDRMQWITHKFHDDFYDYDEFEDGVKKSMIDTLKNYEKFKY